jgi:8-oxo-dGTP pyrophosphatase MutT (NUDIX family)
MEQFAWLSQLCLVPGRDPVLAAGAGFVTMTGGAGAYGSVAQLRDRTRAGSLVSATALLYLSDGRASRFVLLRRDRAAAVGPGLWQFPAARCARDELPLATACRELAQELRIEGAVSDWSEVRIVIGGPQIEYLTQDEIRSFRARYVYLENTVEFYYLMALRVASFDDVKVSDRQPYGRPVRLLDVARIADFALRGELTPAASRIFQQEFMASTAGGNDVGMADASEPSGRWRRRSPAFALPLGEQAA